MCVCVYVCVCVCVYECVCVCVWVCVCVCVYNIQHIRYQGMRCSFWQNSKKVALSSSSARMSSARWRISARYSIYWLYWYKSANADAEGAALLGYWQAWFAWSALCSFGRRPCVLAGTQITCFTGTKVLALLVQKYAWSALSSFGHRPRVLAGTQFPCFTGAKVQFLTLQAPLQTLLVLLGNASIAVLSLLALVVQRQNMEWHALRKLINVNPPQFDKASVLFLMEQHMPGRWILIASRARFPL